MPSLTALTSVTVQATEQRVAGLSVAIQGTETRTVGTDLVVQTTSSLTPGVDAFVQATQQVTSGLSAAVQATETLTPGVSVAVQGTEQQTAGTNLVVQATQQQTAGTDLVVQTVETRGAGADLLVQAVQTLEPGLAVAVQGTEQRTTGAQVLVQDTGSVDTALGLWVALPVDLTAGTQVHTQGTETRATGLGLVVQAPVTRDAAVDTLIQGTAELTADLGVAVQGTAELTAGFDLEVAESRNRAICMHVGVAETIDQYVCLDVSVLDPVVTRCLFPTAAVLIGESRSCAWDLDVLIHQGVKAGLDVLTVQTESVDTTLDLYVRSATLQLGGSAVFNCDGDEIRTILVVEDAGVLRPELVESLTATLRFRSQPQGTVRLGPEHAGSDGYFHAVWIHPAHTTDMDVEVAGEVETLGTVALTLPVTLEPRASQATGPNVSILDDTRPRLEDPGTARETQLDAAPEEVEILDPSLEPLLLSLDLTQAAPLIVGQGPVEYEGGGNRLLHGFDGGFVYQAPGQPPWETGAYTSVEPPGLNLIVNSDFLTPSSTGVPVGWGVTSSASVTTIPSLEQVASVNAAKIRAFGSGNYQGPRWYRLAQQQSTGLTGPTMFSALVRVEMAEGIEIDTLRAVVSLRDAGDTEVSQVTATFSPDQLDDWSVVTVPINSLPGGVTQARMAFELESIETSDDHTLYVLGPNAQPGTDVTSAIVGPGQTTRVADTIRVPQQNNIEVARGHVAIELVPGYPGVPPGDACLFDTRDPLGNQGFAGYHLADGRLRFISANQTTQTVVESAPLGLPQGELKTVAFSWTSGTLGIYVDDVEVAVETTSVTLPTALNQYLYLFRTTTGSDRTNGQLRNVVIERDPLS